MFLLLLIPLACWDNTAKKIKSDTKAHLWYAQNTVLLFDHCNKPTKVKKDLDKEELINMTKQNTFNAKKSCDKLDPRIDKTHEMCTGDFSDNIEHPKAPNDDAEYVEAKRQMSEICAVIELAYNANHAPPVDSGQEASPEQEMPSEQEASPEQKTPPEQEAASEQQPPPKSE